MLFFSKKSQNFFLSFFKILDLEKNAFLSICISKLVKKRATLKKIGLKADITPIHIHAGDASTNT